MPRLLTAGAVSLLLLSVPASAQGATASRISNSLVISAAAGDVDRINVGTDGEDVLVTGPPGSVTPGGGCDPLGSTGADCGPYASVTFVAAILGDRNDRLRVIWPFGDGSPPAVQALGEGGDDRLIGGSGESELIGGAGDDRLGGEHPCCGDPNEAGEDVLAGGPGADLLFGGDDDDELDGGPGADTADYAFSGTRGNVPAVRVDLRRGIATGQGTDSIESCERVIGSDRDDVLSGTAGRNVLAGREGDDVIRGRDGRDKLLGEGGHDVLRARDGRRDLVSGGHASDRARVDAVDILRSIELL